MFLPIKTGSPYSIRLIEVYALFGDNLIFQSSVNKGKKGIGKHGRVSEHGRSLFRANLGFYEGLGECHVICREKIFSRKSLTGYFRSEFHFSVFLRFWFFHMFSNPYIYWFSEGTFYNIILCLFFLGLFTFSFFFIFHF